MHLTHKITQFNDWQVECYSLFPIATVGFNQSEYTVDEDDGLVIVVIILSNPLSTDITVLLEDNNGLATGINKQYIVIIVISILTYKTKKSSFLKGLAIAEFTSISNTITVLLFCKSQPCNIFSSYF